MLEPPQLIQPTTDVDIEQVDMVRVEKSLHSLGFFASTANRGVSRTVIQVFRRPDGRKVESKAVIEGMASLGLPTTADRDKYMAFMKIALDQREFQGQLQNPIRFSGADMIKLLRLRKGGFHYDEINDWCRRMVATTITSENCIFLADRRRYATDIFHVFDRVVLVGEELHDGTRSEFYQVDLSQWQLTNLNQGYLLPLDFNAYLRLKRDISKALFGHLSVWFYASRGQPIEKRYPNLCQLLNICAYPYLSKARSVLEPSLKELTEIGYLSKWELVRTSRGTDFKLILSPGHRLLGLPNFSTIADSQAKIQIDATLPPWVNELVQHGIAERKARQMALDIPDHQPVLDQLEYADYLLQQDRRSRRKIFNAAGFLIWAIESNLVVPSDFQTSTKKQARAISEESESDQRFRSMHSENEYDLFCKTQVQIRLEADYPVDVLESRLADQMKIIKREQPEWFGWASQSLRREVAIGRLKSEILSSLNLPSFEHWNKRDLQKRLF